MAVTKGGFRRAGTFKVSTDTAVRSTMVVDVTGGAGTFYGVECVTGGTTIMLRFYDDTSAVAGTTVPLFSFLCPSASTTSVNIPDGIQALYLNLSEIQTATLPLSTTSTEGLETSSRSSLTTRPTQAQIFISSCTMLRAA